jgi:hypothetical protein
VQAQCEYFSLDDPTGAPCRRSAFAGEVLCWQHLHGEEADSGTLPSPSPGVAATAGPSTATTAAVAAAPPAWQWRAQSTPPLPDQEATTLQPAATTVAGTHDEPNAVGWTLNGQAAGRGLLQSIAATGGAPTATATAVGAAAPPAWQWRAQSTPPHVTATASAAVPPDPACAVGSLLRAPGVWPPPRTDGGARSSAADGAKATPFFCFRLEANKLLNQSKEVVVGSAFKGTVVSARRMPVHDEGRLAFELTLDSGCDSLCWGAHQVHVKPDFALVDYGGEKTGLLHISQITVRTLSRRSVCMHRRCGTEAEPFGGNAG